MGQVSMSGYNEKGDSSHIFLWHSMPLGLCFVFIFILYYYFSPSHLVTALEFSKRFIISLSESDLEMLIYFKCYRYVFIENLFIV